MNKKAYPTKFYIRILVHIIFWIITKKYGVKSNMPTNVKKLKAPYLVLSNHVGFWDPFIVGFFLPKYTHFVSSDAAFRSKLLRFFLVRLGTIPKKKNIRDTKVIRDIKSVINQGENVGLFPEAVRNWAGTSFNLDPSIIKLIRFLDVPVVVATLKGMNLFNPRWAKGLRKTQVEVDYKLLFTPENFNNFSDDEAFEVLSKAMHYDEVDYQREKMHPIYSNKRAEHISHALYVCPSCKGIDTFVASENDFTCSGCSAAVHVNSYGFFESDTGQIPFDNIRDWYFWQEKWLLDFTNNKLVSESKEELFSDSDMFVYHSLPGGEFENLGLAKVSLWHDRISVEFDDKQEMLTFDFDNLQTINPQVNERVEIFYKNEVYRLEGKKPGVSGLKWEVAVNAIWNNLGQKHKLSPYISINN